MKKLSKRQKLIILISLITIIVIIGIIIGANIIITNIANGNYNSSNGSSNNGNLLPEYIKEGITLGGVTGTLKDLDTSDATATAEDILEGKVAYARGERIVGTMKEGPEPIETLDPNEVYYADIEGDGTVDGVIFADLAVGGEGKWNYQNNSYYKIPIETNLKQYFIKEESYKDVFGTGKVIAPIEGTNGNERFYVMALKDFLPVVYYWYHYAMGYLDSEYGVEEDANDFEIEGKGPTGKINTQRMIENWNSSKYGAQDKSDMWGVIQNEVAKGWFVPSKSEWSAFGAKFDLINSNYKNYGLKDVYWSSSYSKDQTIFEADFTFGAMGAVNNGGKYYIRLATTF